MANNLPKILFMIEPEELSRDTDEQTKANLKKLSYTERQESNLFFFKG